MGERLFNLVNKAKCPFLTPDRRKILSFLAYYTNDTINQYKVSYPIMSNRCELSIERVKQCIMELKEPSLIWIERTEGSNCYEINEPLLDLLKVEDYKDSEEEKRFERETADIIPTNHMTHPGVSDDPKREIKKDSLLMTVLMGGLPLNYSERAILGYLVSRTAGDKWVMASFEEMEQACGLHPNTVRYSINNLTRTHFVEITMPRGIPTGYKINKDLIKIHIEKPTELIVNNNDKNLYVSESEYSNEYIKLIF